MFGLPWPLIESGTPACAQTVPARRLVDGATTVRAQRRGVFRALMRAELDAAGVGRGRALVFATAHQKRLRLEAAGLTVIELDSWGNRWCVRANLREWAPLRWHHRVLSRWSLANHRDTPMVVWALAQRPWSR